MHAPQIFMVVLATFGVTTAAWKNGETTKINFKSSAFMWALELLALYFGGFFS